MIIKCKCVGVSRGISKENKKFSTLYFDVTDVIQRYDDENNVGLFVSSLWQSGHFNNECVGCDFTCSVDRFGHVQDIEI